MVREAVLLLFAFLLPAVGGAEESRSALDWLNRMSTASHTLNYEGRLVYQHDGRLISMQLFHGLKGTQERERLVALNGAFREVVRNDDKVTCFLPNNKTIVVEKTDPNPLPIRLPDTPEQLSKFYSLRDEGAERVAGNKTRKIVIVPRDAYRYGQTLWLDEQSGLLLKVEVKDEKHRLVERLMFTSLKVHDGPLPSHLLEPPSMSKDLVWDSPAGQAKGTKETRSEGEWSLSGMPAGFHEELRRQHVLSGSRTSAEQYVLSDGLASVSVFIEPAKGAGGPPRQLKKGALNAYIRYTEGFKVTVLGDVPEMTVRLIGDSVAMDKTEVKQ